MEHETTFRGLEFVIDKAQAAFVQTAVERIAALFHVKVELKDVFSGSAQHQQWISVTGTDDEANKAKDYILALVSPTVTIQMRNICGHPLFTANREEEIERTSGAALIKCEDDSLVISGTEFTVMLAQSMVDDLFSKTCAEVIDTDNKDTSESTALDFGTDVYTELGTDHLRGNAFWNRNNSAFTSVASQLPALTGAATHYTDSISTSDLFANANRNAMTASEQKPAGRPLFPHEHSLYASASAIYPGTLSVTPQICSNGAVTRVCHTLNHAGDGAVPKTNPRVSGSPQHSGQVGCSDLSIEHLKLDTSSRMGSACVSLQAQNQEAYLRNLGQSLHYSKEDIEKGLADYSMDNIVKPADFLKTLNRIKAQRHGGGHPNISTGSRDSPNMPQNSAASNRAATRDTQSQMTVNDYIDLDESVICMGSVSEDNDYVIVSSEDESGETDENMSDCPVAPHPAPSTYHNPALPHSELRVTVREEPTGRMDPQVTLTNNSTTVRENTVASQRQTGRRNLRYIVIDGSNVAMAHGNNRVFSVEGLRISINYFLKRGHDKITAFVPEWRRYSENQTSITGRALLEKLNQDGFVKFTPARRINGKTFACYDDRFILNLAEKEDGVIVSNDQFRDLCKERASYQNIVANRLLQFMFVGDHFMPPDDPLGRHGPNLDEFLRYPDFGPKPAYNNRKDTTLPNQRQPVGANVEEKKSQPERKPSVTLELYQKLAQLFPEPSQVQHILKVLNHHEQETDISRLTNYCLNSLFTQ